MPINLYLPLPGPFAYTPPRRPFRRATNLADGVALVIGWALVATVALLVWMTYGLARLGRSLWRTWRR